MLAEEAQYAIQNEQEDIQNNLASIER